MFSGSVSIPSITKTRPEPGRSMSASSGLAASKLLSLHLASASFSIFLEKGVPLPLYLSAS